MLEFCEDAEAEVSLRDFEAAPELIRLLNRSQIIERLTSQGSLLEVCDGVVTGLQRDYLQMI